MGFLSSDERLRKEIQRRIHAGEFQQTEFARQMGVAQSTLSNYLSGRKGLKNKNRDAAMRVLRLADEALLDPSSPRRIPVERERIPVVAHRTAISAPFITAELVVSWSDIPSDPLSRLPVQSSDDRQQWTRFVAIKVTRAQAKRMVPIFTHGSILIIDRHYQSIKRTFKGRRAIYAISLGDFLSIGYPEIHGSEFIIRGRGLRTELQSFSLKRGQKPEDFVVGRICKILSDA